MTNSTTVTPKQGIKIENQPNKQREKNSPNVLYSLDAKLIKHSKHVSTRITNTYSKLNKVTERIPKDSSIWLLTRFSAIYRKTNNFQEISHLS